jgi:hypothetical protein
MSNNLKEKKNEVLLPLQIQTDRYANDTFITSTKMGVRVRAR